MDERMPVFVKVEEYKDVLGILAEIKTKIEEMNTTLDALDELKEQEDNEIDSWRASIEDVENKVHYVDQTLYEPENL